MGVISRRVARNAIQHVIITPASPTISEAMQEAAAKARPSRAMWVAGVGVAGLTVGVVGEMR